MISRGIRVNPSFCLLQNLKPKTYSKYIPNIYQIQKYKTNITVWHRLNQVARQAKNKYIPNIYQIQNIKQI